MPRSASLAAADASGPRLHRCAFADAPDWIRTALRPEAGEGILVLNAIATVYLDDAGYATLRRSLCCALAPWKERALWVEYERRRGSAPGPLELKLHRVNAGQLESRVMAAGEPRPTELRLRSGWAPAPEQALE